VDLADDLTEARNEVVVETATARRRSSLQRCNGPTMTPSFIVIAETSTAILAARVLISTSILIKLNARRA
jgi:hypothetical protein